MENKTKTWIYGIVITALALVGSVVSLCILLGTELLTATIIGVICALDLALLAVIYLLSRDSQHKIRAAIGTSLAALMLVVQFVGCYYIANGASALSHISRPSVEYVDVGIYVRADDPAGELVDIKDYKVGILAVQDRENTDLALNEAEKEAGFTLVTVEFDGLEALMDGLLKDKTIDAVLLNVAFLDLLSEIEGHEADLEALCELCVIHIEKESTHIEHNELSAMKKNTFTIYISGIDTFGKVSTRSRSDVNIIATVNVKTGEILLVSTPRDYYVPLSISNGIPDKLTHAGIYGIDVSMDTLEMLYDTEIDYYFRVNFDGFKNIIDALGGVTVHSYYDFYVATNHYVVGENTLNGEQALHFARARKPVPGGDQTRGIHQMEVIKGVIKKMTSPSMLLGYSEVMEGIKDSFETNLPYDDISKLVKNQISNGTKWNVTTYAVSGTGATKKPYSQSQNAYVMIPNEDTVAKAKSLMDAVRKGETPKVD
jgi:LCP family protein required for cell wall assembly